MLLLFDGYKCHTNGESVIFRGEDILRLHISLIQINNLNKIIENKICHDHRTV